MSLFQTKKMFKLMVLTVKDHPQIQRKQSGNITGSD